MKWMLAIIAAVALGTVAYANGDEQPQPAPEQKAPQQSGCTSECGVRTVTKYRTIGHRWERVPIKKAYKVKVKDENCCKQPEKVTPNEARVPSLPRKVIEVEQEIVVVPKPKIVYAPAPDVKIEAPPPVAYEQPEVVRVAPAPPPRVIVQPPCFACVPQASAPPPPPPCPGNVCGSQQASWTNQGPDPQCKGKPKNTVFACTNPQTGRESSCYCD